MGSTGSLYAVGYVGEEMDRAHLSLKRYSQFFCLFDLYLAAMLLAVNLENIAIMWIAIEGSTLSAALLIGFDRSKAALEAGWKYVILSAVGIALALFGTILVYYSSEHVLGVSSEALRWSQLYRVAEGLDPGCDQSGLHFRVDRLRDESGRRADAYLAARCACRSPHTGECDVVGEYAHGRRLRDLEIQDRDGSGPLDQNLPAS